MILNCFQTSDELRLTACDYESAVEATRNPEVNTWVDVQGFQTNELIEVLDQFEVQDLARWLCLEARDRPGFYPLKTLIFMVIPLQSALGDVHEVEYMALLCRKNFLLTLHNTRLTRIQRITASQDQIDWLPNGSIAGVVSAIMIVLSTGFLQHLTELRNAIMALEGRMDREPHSVDMSEISDHRSKLLTLEATVSGQLPSLQALTAIDRPFFNLETTREYLFCALANVQAAEKSLHWLEGRIDVIRSLFDMHAQEKMNRRIGRLTILSAIFMPMTLLAGIWGMNFEFMPELKIPFAYPIALGCMGLIGAGMYFFFHKRGWFG
jgi:magnesium transporter